MTAPRRIEVEGLAEFRRDLRKLGTELPRELRKLNKSAAELVVDEARARAQSLGGVAAHVAPSLKAQAQGASAAVKLGGNRYPMAGGAEFGAGRNTPRATARGRVAGWNQFPEWTGNSSDAGRFLYPAIRARQADVIELYGDGIEQLAQRAFGTL